MSEGQQESRFERLRQSLPDRSELRPVFLSHLTRGRAFLLGGILVATLLFSANIGMRLAVRGKVITVPDLVGMSVGDARRSLEDLALGIHVTGERYDASLPAGSVVTQVPAGGVGIKSNRTVQVIASLGRRTHPIPDLVGSSLRAARMMARQNGYEVGHVSIVSDPAAREEQVVAQHPEPGSESGAAQIDILVSRPREVRYVMPQLVGDNVNRVMALLDQSGFRVGRIQYQPSAALSRGTVLRQFPEAGHVVKRGDAVHLEVAR